MNRVQRSIYNFVAALALLSAALFGVWWFQFAHIPTNFVGWMHVADVLLFALVSYVIWHPIMMNILTWAIGSHIRDVPPKYPAPGMSVAFVTTFVPSSESISLLHKSLPSMVAAEYPHDTWLLDEGNDPAAQEVCHQYGVKYFSRRGIEKYNTSGGKYAAKTKGGNHNSWYDMYGNDYDIVAQIDTDFTACPDFLLKTLGYFQDPRVAFVGTPQIYSNDRESFLAKGAAQQTFTFYGPVLRGLYGMDTTLLIGANHVIRVSALKSVGHYSAHITEDLLTGMKLHAKGWKSVYIPEVLAEGEGPTTWHAYFSQQMRWAYGCIDILFHHSPKLLLQMNWRQRIYYFFLQQHYFSGLAMMLGVIGLSLYFIAGLRTANVDLQPLLTLYLPLIGLSVLMTVLLQQFNVRPHYERGFHFAGAVLGIACWPVFFLALFAVFRGKRLSYKVTPKGAGQADDWQSILESPRLFVPHVLIGLLCLGELLSIVITHRSSAIMVFWVATSACLLLSTPFVLQIFGVAIRAQRRLLQTLRRVVRRQVPAPQRLPNPPTMGEKYSYFGSRHRWAFLWLLIASFGILYGFVRVMSKNVATLPMLLLLIVMVPPVLVNTWLRIRKPRLSRIAHLKAVTSWRMHQTTYPSVDIFLPSCGESISVLRNSFAHIARLQWPGIVTVYSLDDSARPEVADLARRFGFRYIVRENRGELKKAGNLINAFNHSRGDFIVVYDADFVPRPDFLYETLPYMDEQNVGVVQTAQYFDIDDSIGWIERYAGTLQEVFFRWIQPARDTFEAAICAGTNVVYRRKAVEAAGGFAEVPIGEDVHSGVKLWAANYKTRYVPVVLAKGLAPDTFSALANQQYRWCRSSMLLMINEHFRRAPFSLAQRLSFWAAFLYYMSSAAVLFTAPVPTLIMIWFYPFGVHPGNYLPMLPAVAATLFVFPTLARGWRPTIYRQCMVNSFCHILAVSHALRGHVEAWVPTGAARKKTGVPQQIRRIMFAWILGTQVLLWAGIVHDLMGHSWQLFWPTIVLGGVQLFMLAPLLFIDISFKRLWFRSLQKLLQRVLGRRRTAPVVAEVYATALKATTN